MTRITNAAPGTSRHGARQRTATLALASSLVVSFLAASSAPTPLYARYEAMWHTGPFIGTVAFAIYAFAVLAGLLTLGRLASYLGRRPILLAAVGGQAVAIALLVSAHSFAPILVARALQGVTAGATFGPLGAIMIEAHAERGTIATAATPGAGTGSGVLASGLVVQFLPGPTHTIYLLLLGVLAAQAVAVVRLIPSAAARKPPLGSLLPRIAVPAIARPGFIGTGPMLFAVWGLAGFYGALGPQLYHALDHGGAEWQGALGLFLLTATASATTVAFRHADGTTMTTVAGSAMLAGLAVTILAVALDQTTLYMGASMIAGVGFGSGFQGPIRQLTPLAAPEERAGLLSAIFVLAYGGMGIPAVVAGGLVSSGTSLTSVALGLAGTLGVLSTGALLVTLRTGPTARLPRAVRAVCSTQPPLPVGGPGLDREP